MSDYLNNETVVQELTYKDQPVKLINPGFDGMAPFLRIARELSKGNFEIGDSLDLMRNMNNDVVEDLMLLVRLTVQKTFKESWNSDKEYIEQWTMENLIILMGKVLELCMPKMSREELKKQQMIQKLKDNDNKSS